MTYGPRTSLELEGDFSELQVVSALGEKTGSATANVCVRWRTTVNQNCDGRYKNYCFNRYISGFHTVIG
jgi:hypothetical protein